MSLFTFYADNLCFKWRFKRGVLTGKICQKWDFMPGRVVMSVLDSALKLYLLTRTLNIIGWKLCVIVWVLWDHYHIFKTVKKVFGGVLKKDCLKVFAKTWMLKGRRFLKRLISCQLCVHDIIYRLIFELCCVWWNQMIVCLC